MPAPKANKHAATTCYTSRLNVGCDEADKAKWKRVVNKERGAFTKWVNDTLNNEADKLEKEG